jgi:hypothetical protein
MASAYSTTQNQKTHPCQLLSCMMLSSHNHNPERFMEFGNESNERNESQVCHLRCEDLMEGHCTSINQVLEFMGNETVISSNDTDKISRPPSLVPLGDKNHVSKSTAFASPALVDRTWNLVECRKRTKLWMRQTADNSKLPLYQLMCFFTRHGEGTAEGSLFDVHPKVEESFPIRAFRSAAGT